MKKILLTIGIALLIFQMVVLAVDISIGATAIDRGYNRPSNQTYIDKYNPANTSGTITQIEIWAAVNLANCKVATFYVVSGDNFSTRDYEVIGAVTSGSKQTFNVNIDVQEGDYIGLSFTAGNIECENSGSTIYYHWNVDIIPCSNETFWAEGNSQLSLHGIGTTGEEKANVIFFGTNF